jgi:hypothetical protein
MAEPTDMALYNETKNEVDKSYDKPSAYRSMAYTRFYLRAFREKYGNDKKAYKGKKPGDLEKWRRDKWIDVRSYLDVPEDPKACGSVEYDRKEYPLCMPLSKVKKYDKNELQSFLNQKSKIGKSRLVKESFLNAIDEKPIKTKMEKEVVEKKAVGRPRVEKEPVEKKPVGRPRVEKEPVVKIIRPKKEPVAKTVRPKKEKIERPVRANKNEDGEEVFYDTSKPVKIERPSIDKLNMTF